MSAPMSHDPVAVNTRDGVCWERRAVTDSGLGLYAVEGSCKCPPFKMATLAELAERGIVGSAYALPMSAGPAPRDPITAGRGLDLLALMDERAASVVSPVLAAVLEEAERLRAERASIGNEIARFGIYGAALPAARALVKRADEVVTENAALRARVAELEAERHSTNEALDDAVRELRARPVVPEREPEFHSALHHAYRLGHDLPETGGTR